MPTIHDIEALVMSYIQNKTPKGLKSVVHALLDTETNKALFILVDSKNPDVLLAVAEALLWSRELKANEKGKALSLKDRRYPLFEKFARNQGDTDTETETTTNATRTTSNVAKVIVMLAATQLVRKEEICNVIRAYRSGYGNFYFAGDESEGKLYQLLLEPEEAAPAAT